MAGDLFGTIDALFTKQDIERPAPFYLVHRFLASDPDYAIACRVLQTDIMKGDPRILLKIWQGLLPRGRKAPRLSYVAPKKRPKEDELTAAIMKELGVSRRVAEETLEVLELAGKIQDLFSYYGIEAPGEENSNG